MGPFFIYVIVPFSRPMMLGNVLANFKRQDYVNKKLIIVANGKAKNTNIECDELLISKDSPSDAKNVGIKWLNDNGGEYFSIFDDDDFYGPEYLSEVAYYKDKATVIGKNIHYFQCESGLYLANTDCETSYVKRVHGPTLSCHSLEAPIYPEGLNEEDKFCQKIRMRGGSVFNTTMNNYIYMRRGNNTWKIPDKELVIRLNAKKVENGRAT